MYMYDGYDDEEAIGSMMVKVAVANDEMIILAVMQ